MILVEYLLLVSIVAWLIIGAIAFKEGTMPVATTSGDETQRYELKSLEGAWVELRQLTYGEWLRRRAMSSNMALKGGGGKGKGKDDFEGVMQLVNEKATQFEFANCIVDHNLEDADGNKLNFKKSSTLNTLNPKVGEEIALRISNLNQFDEDLDEEDFELESSG